MAQLVITTMMRTNVWSGRVFDRVLDRFPSRR
jgi:hypothetical protein